MLGFLIKKGVMYFYQPSQGGYFYGRKLGLKIGSIMTNSGPR